MSNTQTYRTATEVALAAYTDNEAAHYIDWMMNGPFEMVPSDEMINRELGTTPEDWSWINAVLNRHEVTASGDGYLFD